MQGSRPDTWDTSFTVTIFGSVGYRLCALRRVLRCSRVSARSRSPVLAPDCLQDLQHGLDAPRRRRGDVHRTQRRPHASTHTWDITCAGLWMTFANIVIVTPFKHVLANSTTLVLPIRGEYPPTALARPHADAPDEHSLLHGIGFIKTAGRLNGGRPPSRDWVPK